MKKVLSLLKRYIFSIIAIGIIGFTFGFFLVHGVINAYFYHYDVYVTINNDKEITEYFNEEYFTSYYNYFEEENEQRKNFNLDAIEHNKNIGIDIEYTTVSKYNEALKKLNNNEAIELKSLLTIANIDYKPMLNGIKTEKLGENQYKVSIQRKYFQDIFSNSKADVTKGESRIPGYLNKIFTMDKNNIVIDSNIVENQLDPFIFSTITTVSFMIIYSILICLYYKNKEYVDIFDNENIFKFPIKRKYWKKAIEPFKNLKSLVTIAILFSLMLVCKLIHLPSGFGELGIGITYLIFSTIAMLYGPIIGIVIGFLSDNLGFLLFQSGAMYFPGYTLDAMLAGLVYGLAFYKTKVTFTKCLAARIVVNLFINVILGSIWYQFVYLGGFDFEVYKTYLLLISLPKNLLYLLPQSIFLYIILKALSRPCTRAGLLDQRIADNMHLI